LKEIKSDKPYLSSYPAFIENLSKILLLFKKNLFLRQEKWISPAPNLLTQDN